MKWVASPKGSGGQLVPKAAVNSRPTGGATSLAVVGTPGPQSGRPPVLSNTSSPPNSRASGLIIPSMPKPTRLNGDGSSRLPVMALRAGSPVNRYGVLPVDSPPTVMSSAAVPGSHTRPSGRSRGSALRFNVGMWEYPNVRRIQWNRGVRLGTGLHLDSVVSTERWESAITDALHRKMKRTVRVS